MTYRYTNRVSEFNLFKPGQKMDTEKYSLQCDGCGWTMEGYASSPSECPTCGNNKNVVIFGPNGQLLWDSGQRVNQG